MIEWLEKKRYPAIFLTLLIAIEIFYFSSIPGARLMAGNLDLSIAYHLFVFFLLNFFLLISVNGSKKIRIKSLIVVLVVSLAYAFLDEIHQIFVPFRYPDIGDILINSTGIFISALVYLYYKNR